MTIMTKDGKKMRVSGDAQVSAFINSGWTVAEENALSTDQEKSVREAMGLPETPPKGPGRPKKAPEKAGGFGADASREVAD